MDMAHLIQEELDGGSSWASTGSGKYIAGAGSNNGVGRCRFSVSVVVEREIHLTVVVDY